MRLLWMTWLECWPLSRSCEGRQHAQCNGESPVNWPLRKASKCITDLRNCKILDDSQHMFLNHTSLEASVNNRCTTIVVQLPPGQPRFAQHRTVEDFGPCQIFWFLATERTPPSPLLHQLGTGTITIINHGCRAQNYPHLQVRFQKFVCHDLFFVTAAFTP